MTAEEIAEQVALGVAAAVSEITQAVLAAVREIVATPPLPRLTYSSAEVAVITGTNPRWWDELGSAEQIPSCKLGGPRRYSWDQILATVAAHEIAPSSGPMAKQASRK